MSRRPNILFIMSDQHSPHVLGCAGNSIINTPSLDRLAAEGMLFDQTYCQNPLCAPSRASVLTGRYSKDIGIYDNMHVLESNSLTFPRLLSKAGYRTCLIGKSHLNGEQFQGYQERPYGDLYGQAHQPDPRRMPEFGINGLGDVVGNHGASEIPDPLTQTEICVAEACKWMQLHTAQHPEQPFLLSVHFDKPHFPIRPPKRFQEKYEGKVNLPETPEGYIDGVVPFIREAIANNETGHHYGKDFDLQLGALESYYGCVEWVDDAVGRIVEVLDYLGLKENTLVIYTTDHGEMGGEKGTWQKTLFFDASARVPFIMRWPERIRPGTRSSEIAGLIDCFPTICEAAGIEVPDTCGGVSLLPVMQGGTLEREGIFSESAVLRKTEVAGCMYRTGPWKYCRYLDGSEELYHLKDDPDEWTNRAADRDCKDVVKLLRQATLEFWEPDKYLERLRRTPIMSGEKHFYEFSNQFVTGTGAILDGRP
ncbi:MAG: sulfatase [Puniceicoccaceae bacterium]